MFKDDDLYSELAFYTLAHPDPAFIHQLVVDAYTAQNADDAKKPMAVVFALIGLYLHLEKSYTGRMVQRAHMQLANRSRIWPRIPIPSGRGTLTIEHVVAAEPGPARDAMIGRWCDSVWQSWLPSRSAIIDIAQKYLGTD